MRETNSNDLSDYYGVGVKMKTALVIGGGGSKGAFAVGAIEVLRENGISFDIVAGTSTGALIAPMVAIDDIDELIKQYTKVHTRDIIRKNWRGLFWNGIHHTRPLKKRMRKTLAEGEPSRYERLMSADAARVFICAVGIQSVSPTYFSQRSDELATAWKDQEECLLAILGSASQPVFMTLPEFRGEQWADGGLREIAPLSIALKAGAERVFVMLHSVHEGFDKTTEHYTNLLSIGKRTLNLMLDEIVMNDVKQAKLYNRAIDCGAKFEGKRRIDMTIIRPHEPLPSDGLTFEPVVMQHMRELGQEAAHKVLADSGGI